MDVGATLARINYVYIYSFDSSYFIIFCIMSFNKKIWVVSEFLQLGFLGMVKAIWILNQ